MSVAARILTTYRDPRGVMRAHLAEGVREDRALAVLMAACLLIFVAQWPGLARAAHLDPSTPLDARLGGALMSTMFLFPLFAYLLAALSHLAARAFGGRGSGFGARLALFWSLLAVSPLMLFQGLVAGFVGPGAAQIVVGLAVGAVFLFLWLSALAEAGRAGQPQGH
ncbi:YIP1 family protein [Ruixingdingia sedimenti]|uniref:YIP1 family protein n=1 Tax=Ruixingdingia sedimenti TaxID=3073604 RepID=A0ABU1FC57_9RHOB|nr:YIP1 family protein [Xinfangfangia sp. LG-4]MDR5654495.1 YIP1 family protein [Xinfangfangia sp. LG-4]